MSLIYVTGLSGSGKSSLCEELKRRGYEAHDADSEGFNRWCDKVTGKVVEGYVVNNLRSKERLEKYSWNTSYEMVERLARSSKNKLIFLCGISANEETVWNLFTKVICLIVSKETLQDRIKTRNTSDFGKDSYELKLVLDWYDTYPGDYLKMGAITVDANFPLSTVADEVLRLVHERNKY